MPLLVLDIRNTIIINDQIDPALLPILRAFHDAGWYIVTADHADSTGSIAAELSQKLAAAGLDEFITTNYPADHKNFESKSQVLGNYQRQFGVADSNEVYFYDDEEKHVKQTRDQSFKNAYQVTEINNLKSSLTLLAKNHNINVEAEVDELEQSDTNRKWRKGELDKNKARYEDSGTSTMPHHKQIKSVSSQNSKSLPSKNKQKSRKEKIDERVEDVKKIHHNKKPILVIFPEKPAPKPKNIKIDVSTPVHDRAAIHRSFIDERNPVEIVKDIFITTYKVADPLVNDMSRGIIGNIAVLKCSPSIITSIHDDARLGQVPEENLHVLEDITDADKQCDTDIERHFQKAFDFIDNAINKGMKVYVYCDIPTSFSPTIVAAYLMKKHGFTATDACNHVINRLPCAEIPGTKVTVYDKDPNKPSHLESQHCNHEQSCKRGTSYKQQLDAYELKLKNMPVMPVLLHRAPNNAKLYFISVLVGAAVIIAATILSFVSLGLLAPASLATVAILAASTFSLVGGLPTAITIGSVSALAVGAALGGIAGKVISSIKQWFNRETSSAEKSDTKPASAVVSLGQAAINIRDLSKNVDKPAHHTMKYFNTTFHYYSIGDDTIKLSSGHGRYVYMSNTASVHLLQCAIEFSLQQGYGGNVKVMLPKDHQDQYRHIYLQLGFISDSNNNERELYLSLESILAWKTKIAADPILLSDEELKALRLLPAQSTADIHNALGTKPKLSVVANSDDSENIATSNVTDSLMPAQPDPTDTASHTSSLRASQG